MSPSSSFFFLLLFNLLFLFFNLPPSIGQQQQEQEVLSSFNISHSPWHPTQNRTLVSPNSNFIAGFFPIPNSRNLFTFSVWFSKAPKTTDAVVWNATAAATTTPLNANSSLVITPNGQILLNGSPLANNNASSSTSSSNTTQLTLTDQGNLFFGNWSSFDNPTNTILPNQNISVTTTLISNNGKYKFVNSSSLILSSGASPQYYTTPNPLLSMDDLGKMTMVGNGFLTSDYGENNFRKLVLDDDGNLKIYSFDQSQWNVVWRGIWENCKIKGRCGGAYAICVPSEDLSTDTSCVCPSGFTRNGASVAENGCTRKIPLSNNTDFIRLDYVNYTSGQMNQISAENFTICEASCHTEPECLGFGFKYDGSGYCVLLLGKELLYGYWSPGTETALFLKVDRKEREPSNFVGLTEVMQTTCPVNISLPLPPKDSNATTRNIAIICTLFALELISGVAFFWSFVKRYIKYRDMATTLGLELLPAGGPKRFTYSELKAATNDFSSLIGRGGFGDVFKGELPDHRVVAVKCLKNVTGGDAEFWSEVTSIARMHHLNLVRLWGFCTEKGRRILVYEYIPGGSLDKYLFRVNKYNNNNSGAADSDQNKREKPVLDWNVRYRIALGVARAIAYLHEECLEWVLHCDIKPENILLGEDFCPKISDFGLAKMRKKEDMVTMSRRRGTPGYMAPEWITADPITAKADVYSFGMVLLEIVSGVRNFETQGSVVRSEEWYFPGWAFDKMFKEMRVEDVLDAQIREFYDNRAHFDSVNRMVKTAMWCLQDRPELRPTMGKVAKMLEGTVEITQPKKPTVFFLGEE